MKALFFLALVFSVLGEAQTKKLSPFQIQLQMCLDPKLSLEGLDSSKKLYEAFQKFYPLVGSRTTYREVLYSQKGELKKLKFENKLVRVFAVSDDQSLRLLSSESSDETKADNILRHKIVNADQKVNELLFRADIRSDYRQVSEFRSSGLNLNITWVDSQIKAFVAEFSDTKKTLSCERLETSDICTCKR